MCALPLFASSVLARHETPEIRLGARAAELRRLIAAQRSGLEVVRDEDPDVDADLTFGRELASRVISPAATELREIEDALSRLRAGTYGVCEDCDGTISERRLAAKPAARLCVGCAEKREREE